mmetsp:Transcript_14697/g.28259  ORF Transcript_14697/g.28259 Transcript_14697/m.28259 type:complete len:537 (+) Transcript_14697:150-1760(+)|eukprot:CAMPEP_0114233618 /NCGR_PEP_ID=MMETSP0058-20121206/5266_1 /TAXON_ID=36894 /ORGANISM="Pyramimonas parkeae, CCMP726" /LENGTH=536 /DNA_ID=CAMNT_0001345231 /DNA_START=95 /DNA_END=1705 /DNA_ORIENTATION=+
MVATVKKTRATELAELAPKQEICHGLPFRYYLRSADSLLLKAKSARLEEDDENLYVYLLRWSSLVLETIPQHKDAQTPENTRERQEGAKDLGKVLAELESLKETISKRPAMSDSFGGADSDRNEAARTPLMATDQLAHANDYHVPRNQQHQINAYPSSGHAQLFPSSSATTHPVTSSSLASRSAGVRYPDLQVDDSLSKLSSLSILNPDAPLPSISSIPSAPPAPPLDAGYSVYDSVLPSAPPVQWPVMGPSPPHQQSQATQPMMYTPGPQRPLALPPQPVEVTYQQPPPPGAGLHGPNLCRCCRPPPFWPQQPRVLTSQPPNRMPPPPPLMQGSTNQTSSHHWSRQSSGGRRQGLMAGFKDVHIDPRILEAFLRIAERNTRNNLETCAMLAGTLRGGVFVVTTLIVPKQESTADTCDTLNEEDVFMFQDARSLVSLGWVHTHPTQTCFMSSVDLHTHAGYQTLLDEAVAIVMAPQDPDRRFGIFRLATPSGLRMIQQCRERGFHPHTMADGGEIYEHSSHVLLNEQIKWEVADLR